MKVCLFGLEPGENDETVLLAIDSRAEMSVRVQKGAFMIDTLGSYNFGLNVVSETSELKHRPSRR